MTFQSLWSSYHISKPQSFVIHIAMINSVLLCKSIPDRDIEVRRDLITNKTVTALGMVGYYVKPFLSQLITCEKCIEISKVFDLIQWVSVTDTAVI